MVFLVLGLIPLLLEEPLSVRDPDLVGLAAELVDDEEALGVGLPSVVDGGGVEVVWAGTDEDLEGEFELVEGGGVVEEGVEELGVELGVVLLLEGVELGLAVGEVLGLDELDELLADVEGVVDDEPVFVEPSIIEPRAPRPLFPSFPLFWRPTISGCKMVAWEMAMAARRATTDCARNSMMLILFDGCGLKRRIRRSV
jgi:hypothetical protein